jgi:hypothetical protein
MFAANVLIMALSLFFQARIFPAAAAIHEENVDTLATPMVNPETALAERALKAHGLCAVAAGGGKITASAMASRDDSVLTEEDAEAASLCARH